MSSTACRHKPLAALLTGISLAIALGSCAAPGAQRWRRVDAASFDGGQQAQLDRALAAKNTLATRLMKRLGEALSSGGPSEAIAVCKTEAPAMTESVGETAVRIGRTSFALRNPANTPPDWAAALVAERVAEPVYQQHDDGTLAALLPIRMQALCTTCHGPAATIAPEVRQQLQRLYPNDEATGFKVDELRGYFWVEVPAEGT